MSDEISFQLFGEGGFVAPTRWSYTGRGPDGRPNDPSRHGGRWDIPFYDWRSQKFLRKQTQEFDGGWRWFDTHDIEALTLYNIKLDRRAYTLITKLEAVDTAVSAEFVLYCAKSMVVLEHSYYTVREYVLDSIKAMFKRARIEIMKEISGESHLHPVL